MVAAHLVNTHKLEDIEEKGWPRRKKDWLDRCLDSSKPDIANALDHDSLRLICDAFAMTARHRSQLDALWESTPDARAPVQPAGATEPGLTKRAAEVEQTAARGYHSIWVVEDHHVGPDRRPRLHRTTRTVVSEVDDLRSITHAFDANGVAVEVELGGRADGPIRRICDGLWDQPIVLDRPAARGEHRDLVYATYFQHREDPAPEIRRSGSSDPHAHIEIRVHFDTECLPATISICVWKGLEAVPQTEVMTELDDEHSATEVFNAVQPGGLVGFCWTWPGAAPDAATRPGWRAVAGDPRRAPPSSRPRRRN